MVLIEVEGKAAEVSDSSCRGVPLHDDLLELILVFDVLGLLGRRGEAGINSRIGIRSDFLFNLKNPKELLEVWLATATAPSHGIMPTLKS